MGPVSSSRHPDTRPLVPVALSHHYAGEADRCLTVGRWHLCRRCTAMFAGFFPAVVVLLSPWQDELQAGDIGLVLALTVVAGLEFVQVIRRRMPYSARRVLLLSPAVGASLAWLGTTGIRDGFGPAHLAAGAVAAAVLAALFAHGTVVRARSAAT